MWNVVWGGAGCDPSIYPTDPTGLTAPTASTTPTASSAPTADVKNSSLSGDRTADINVDMGDSVQQVQYRVVSGDVIISGRHVKHKFADPVLVSRI